MKWNGIAAAAMSFALPISAQQLQISKENKTIAITTSDEASAVADIAVIDIGFQAYGKDQDATYDQASQTSNAIYKALTGAAVPKEAIESTGQNLSPLAPNGQENNSRYAQGLRFQFSQNWHVTVPAGEAAKTLQVAISAGANNSGNIDWQLRHDDALQAQAAGKALEHAREIASTMAKGLGVRLGSLVYASNQTPPRSILEAREFTENAQGSAQAALLEPRRISALAISPQRITKSATVYAVFAIE